MILYKKEKMPLLGVVWESGLWWEGGGLNTGDSPEGAWRGEGSECLEEENG